MVKNLLSTFALHVTNSLSTKPGGKILYIESDDWGMLRMRSKKVKEILVDKGYKIRDCVFNSYDRLENNDDLQHVMEVLHTVKDRDGRPALLVLNNIVANPDFEKIEKSGFEQYYYQKFYETYSQYGDTTNVMNLYREGIQSGCFLPQFHGREHVHVNNWMQDLRTREKTAMDGFYNGMFSITAGIGSDCKKEYLDAMAFHHDKDIPVITKSIKEGLDIFKDVWGFHSQTAIAPCYTWNDKVEEEFDKNGVKVLQSGRAQKIQENSNFRIVRRITGEKNKWNQKYTVRNVFFEPSTDKNSDWVDYGLSQIKNAFFWGAPAILSTHRVNFIGSIDPKNRDFGLSELKKLLIKTKQLWPDVQFIHPFIKN